jgi:hypothetical protein
VFEKDMRVFIINLLRWKTYMKMGLFHVGFAFSCVLLRIFDKLLRNALKVNG